MSTIRVLALAWVLSACSDGLREWEPCAPDENEGAPGEVQRYDSAGVEIIVTPCEVAMTSSGWQIEKIPLLDVGGSDDAYFSRLQGAARAPGGGVVALDLSPPRLLLLREPDYSPELLATEGAGPGELGAPVFVRRPTSQSVLIFDRRTRRFTDWTNIEARRFEVQDAPWLRHLPLGAVGGSVLVEEYVLDRRIAEPGLHREPITLSWVSMADGSREPLLETEFERSFGWVSSETGLPTAAPLPYAAYPHAAIHPDGAVVTTGDGFEVMLFDTLGVLRRIFRVPARPAAVDDGVRATLRAALDRPSTGPLTSGMVQELPLPDSIAPFRGLLTDELGWTWAEIEQADPMGPRKWLIFDRDGVGRGTVDFPFRISILGFGDSSILASWSDSLGVQHLLEYRLERVGGVEDARRDALNQNR